MPNLHQNLSAEIESLKIQLQSARQEYYSRSFVKRRGLPLIKGVFGYATEDNDQSIRQLLEKPNKFIHTLDLERKIYLIKDRIKALSNDIRSINNFQQKLEGELTAKKVRQDLELNALRLERTQLEAVQLTTQRKSELERMAQQLRLSVENDILNLALRDKGATFFIKLSDMHKDILGKTSLDVDQNTMSNNGLNEANLEKMVQEIIIMLDNKLAMDINKLWQCSNVLHAAIMLQQAVIKNSPTDENKFKLEECQRNYSRLQKFLLPQLPLELKLMKVLFAAGEHLSIASLLRDYFMLPAGESQAKLLLINSLETALQTKYMEIAKATLESEHQDFASLSKELQNSLIEQQCYILLKNIELSFTLNTDDVTENEFKELTNNTIAFDANVTAANILQASNNQILDQDKSDYQEIHKKLKKIDRDARNSFLVNQIIHPSNVISGIVNLTGSSAAENTASTVAIVPSINQVQRPNNSMTLFSYGAWFAATANLVNGGLLPLYGLFSFVTIIMQYIVLPGIGLKIITEAATIEFPEIKNKIKALEELPEADAAFLHNQEEFWDHKQNIQFASDLTEIENNYFQELYQEYKAGIEEWYHKKEDDFKKTVRTVINDTTSSTTELFLIFVKVMAGVAFLVTSVLITVFALSGLNGPFLLFAFVPALSTSIIIGLAVISAKLNFEGNVTANKLIDSFVWLCYSPVLFVFSSLEYMFRPINSVLGMLQADNDGNPPSLSNKLWGATTIVLGITCAAGLAIAFPYIAPALGIATGLAIASGVIVGAYGGLSLGVIAKQTYDRILNRPTIKISQSKDKLLTMMQFVNHDNNKVLVDKFTAQFPSLALPLLNALQNRSAAILQDIATLDAELPSLWQVATTEIKKIPAAVENQQEEPINLEIQYKLDSIAKKIAYLKISQEDLLKSFEAYDAEPNSENKTLFMDTVERILVNEYKTARAQFKATSLANSKKQQEPGYDESIKPTLLFNKAANFELVNAPEFVLSRAVDCAAQRQDLNRLRLLEEERRMVARIAPPVS